MRRLLIFHYLLFVAFYGSLSFAGLLTGLETPLSTNEATYELDKSTTPNAPVRSRCIEYPNFAVFEMNRPSLVGAETIEVRPKTAGVKLHRLCGRHYKGGKFPLKNIDGNFAGASGQFVLLGCADSHGGACEFSVFDALTGKKLVSDIYQKELPFKMEPGKKSVSVSFHKVLSQKSRESCRPNAKDHVCWDQILAENAVPASVVYPIPDCEKLYVKHPEYRTQYGTQFSAPAQVEYATKSTLTYLKGEPICGLEP